MPGVTPAKSLYLVVLIRLLDLEPANSRGTSTNNSTLFPSRQIGLGGVSNHGGSRRGQDAGSPSQSGYYPCACKS